MRKKKLKSYRGFRVCWEGTTDGGHWLIYDNLLNFCGSADAEELDDILDELNNSN